MRKLLAESEWNIPGRGMIFAVDLNQLPPGVKLWEDDEIQVDGVVYRIVGFEIARTLMDQIVQPVGVRVRKIDE